MLNNIRAKKKLTQIIIAVLCLCMAFAGTYLISSLVPNASAQTVARDVSDASSWTSAIGAVTSGDTLNITLTGDIAASAKLTAIPSGITVNLNMNGHSILWDYTGTSTTGVMNTSYPPNSDYCGLITNNGTLSITGTGTIRSKQVMYNLGNNGSNDNYPGRLYTIINSSGATMTISTGVNIQAYLDVAFTSNAVTSAYNDIFVYAIGIYNEGTVTSGANITVGVLAGGTSLRNAGWSGHSSYKYSFGYGIYGGNVTTAGGTISVGTYSGALGSNSYCATGDQICAYSFGVYSNNAKILGATTINTSSTTWQDRKTYDNWGTNVSWSVGVLYLGENYPVIGPAVNINASFTFWADKHTLQIPGEESNSSLVYSDCQTTDDMDIYGRRAYAVAGVEQNVATIGDNTSEYGWNTDSKGFFGSNSSQSGDECYLNCWSNKYYTEHNYREGTMNSSTVIDASSQNQSQSGIRSDETKTSSITNGAPGSDGGQYVSVYRFYDTTMSSSTLQRVDFSWDSNWENSYASYNINNGLFTASDNIIKYSTGAQPANEKFYKLYSKTWEKVTSTVYGNRSKDYMASWSANGNTLTDSGTGATSAGNTIIIYYNYTKLDPTGSYIFTGNKGVTPTTDNQQTPQDITMTYTGTNVVPGTDFVVKVYDDNRSAQDVTDDTDVTSDYDIARNGSGIKVTYEYSSDGGTTWTTTAPINVGSYKLRITTSDDIIYSKTAKNRTGDTKTVNLTIIKADPTITYPTSLTVTYGQTTGSYINLSAYSAKGVNSSAISGTYSVAGATGYLNASTAAQTVNVTWTPSGTYAASYNSKTVPVNITVNKAELYVHAANATTTYGTATAPFSLEFNAASGISDNDLSYITEWSAAATYTVTVGGSDVVYYAKIPVSTTPYAVKVTSLSSGTNINNYNVHLNKVDAATDAASTLTVNKAPIYYVATAQDRVYNGNNNNGNNNINVTLRYATGAMTGDSPVDITTVPATTATADAGVNKPVTVDTAAIMANPEYSAFFSNYTLYISNAADLKATISKATPVASCTANPNAVVYDKARTLNDIALVANNTTSGTWSWKDSTITPTVGQATYTAVFTPSTSNYISIEQEVTITVSQKTVTAKAAATSVVYGNTLPSITVVYDGFTGGDTLATSGATGDCYARATEYAPGSPVGEYDITLTNTLVSENYNFVIDESVKLNVTRRPVTVTAKNDTMVYGSAFKNYSASQVTVTGLYGSDTLGGTLLISSNYNTGAAETRKVGTYNLIPQGYSSSNYTITYVNGTLTITKANLTVNPGVPTGTYTYGGNAPAFTYSFLTTDFKFDDTSDVVSGEPTYNTNYTNVSPVGSYYVSINVAPLAAENYSFVAGSNATLVIAKATPVKTEDPNVTITLGESLGDAVFTDGTWTNPNNGVVVPGSYAFVNSTVTPGYYDTDEYSYVFTPNDTDNYTTGTATAAPGIDPKTVGGSLTITGSPMDGFVLGLDLSSLDPSTASSYSAFTWYYAKADGTADTAAGVLATAQTYTVKTADIGKKIVVVASANSFAGYNGSVTSQPTATVTQAFNTIVSADELDVNAANATYDGNAHTATVTAKSGLTDKVGEITVLYNGSVTAPVNAGTYDITVNVAAPDLHGATDTTGYYGPISGLHVGTMVISPKDFTVTVTVNDKTYNGSTAAEMKTISTDGKIGSDDVSVATGYSFAFATASAGTSKTVNARNLKLTGADNENYNLVAVINPATINKATLTAANAVPVSRSYVKGNVSVDVNIINITGYIGSDSATTVYPTDGKGVLDSDTAGLGKPVTDITYTLAGDSAGNYALVIENIATVDITQATPTFTAPVINGYTYNKNTHLSGIDLTAYNTADGSFSFKSQETIPTVAITSYAATYTPADSNYKTVDTTITINISKKAVTIKATAPDISYGSEIPTFTLTATGFTGDDSISTIGGDFKVSSAYTKGSPKGTYTIYQTVNTLDNSNYAYTFVSSTFKVNPRTLTVSATAVDKVYDKTTNVTVNFAIASGKYGSDDITLSKFATAGTTPTANAGKSIVTYDAPTLEGGTADNYVLYIADAQTSGNLIVNVSKANLTGIIFPESATLGYGLSLSSAVFSDSGTGNGKFAYKEKDTVPAAITVYSNYIVVFTPTDAQNYNTIEQTVKLTVQQNSIAYDIEITGKATAGQTLTAVVVHLPEAAKGYVVYQWYRMDSNETKTPISGANSATYTLTSDDVKYYVGVATCFADNAPYTMSSDADTTPFIMNGSSKECMCAQTSTTIAEVQLSFWERFMRWIYKIIAAITGMKITSGIGG